MKSQQWINGRKQRRLSDAEELELVAMYEHNSRLTLANAFGIANETVTRILSDHGVKLRPKGRPKHDKN